jgi:DNA-directed RNA polymerase specialized sigma24 family protein
MTTDDFDAFFRDAEPRLRRAFACRVAPHTVPDAVGAALEYAWVNWDRVAPMEFRVAYLFRVGLSRTRRRREGLLPAPPSADGIHVEPGRVDAFRRLPPRQRDVVWLVDACGWTPTEAAEALGLSLSATRTHRTRGLDGLRRHLGVHTDA